MKTITKPQLIDEMQAKLPEMSSASLHKLSKKDLKDLTTLMFDTIEQHLGEGDRVQLAGFGTFETRDRQARTGVKPGTSERIEIPASKFPAFKPGKELKNAVNA